ncbi:unnamed protein product [Miscanthus lutarioriparius]|uniref:Uncharacterized protein n=1 Tax=Miscanthus lutarioriparius TaxID=422564 RepID=A0A811R7V6_9POAL|nr:unnamed protein product [Miscanthus lutarioriparius]
MASTTTKVQRIMTQVTQPIGFDEYMTLVLDDAEEINVKKNSRKSLVAREYSYGRNDGWRLP